MANVTYAAGDIIKEETGRIGVVLKDDSKVLMINENCVIKNMDHLLISNLVDVVLGILPMLDSEKQRIPTEYKLIIDAVLISQGLEPFFKLQMTPGRK